MDKEKLSAMLWTVIPEVIQLVMDNRKLSNEEAIKLFYNSEVYKMLEIEESKLWHFSANMLYTLLEEELTTGKITWPEEA
jgi:hypothetical protein